MTSAELESNGDTKKSCILEHVWNTCLTLRDDTNLLFSLFFLGTWQHGAAGAITGRETGAVRLLFEDGIYYFPLLIGHACGRRDDLVVFICCIESIGSGVLIV
jgi:hypothetical protein